MNPATVPEIWTLIDWRSRRLFDGSLNVLTLAGELARGIAGRSAALLMTADAPADTQPDPSSDACLATAAVQQDLQVCGADRLYRVTGEDLAFPQAHVLAPLLAELVRQHRPRLVLLPLNDLGRDIAARAAALCRVGLIADCTDIRSDEQGRLVGLCPAWGGAILAEITFAAGQTSGFATVQPHCRTASRAAGRSVETIVWPAPAMPGAPQLELVARQTAADAEQDLNRAATVVVGGAGLGSSAGFGLVRDLAVAAGAALGATRPPVLQRWVAADRLIGQTGRTVRPRLLFSIGTSGAVQYTSGITAAGTIVAVNRDPHAPIFQMADVGVVADAIQFLPHLISRVQQTVMRSLADRLCGTDPQGPGEQAFGARIRKLRQDRGWSVEALAEATGQTPEFITQVETAMLTPPVSFLLGLAGAFKIDPGTFLNPEAQSAIRDQRRRAHVQRTQNYSYQSLSAGAEHDRLRAFLVTIEPRQAHKPVAYKHQGEEFIYVMSGRLELTLGEKVQVLDTGDALHFNSDIPHKLKNPAAETTRCLVVLYTP